MPILSDFSGALDGPIALAVGLLLVLALGAYFWTRRGAEDGE